MSCAWSSHLNPDSELLHKLFKTAAITLQCTAQHPVHVHNQRSAPPALRPTPLPPALGLFILVAVNQSLNSEASMNLFKSAVVLVFAVAICGCERSQPTAPVATSNPAPATTNNPTPVELPESASAIGMEFKFDLPP